MFKNTVIKLIKSIIKYHTIITIIAILFTVLTAYIAIERFSIKTSLTALLPEDSESVRVLNEVKKTKGSTDNMIIILENDNTDSLKEFAKIIYDKLKNDPMILTIEYRRDIKFIKDRILFHVPIKDLEEMETKLRERISKTKFDKITDIGLDDKDINPEITDSDGELLESEGDPFKKEMKARKVGKDIEVTYDIDKTGSEVEKTLENCDPDSDEGCDEDEGSFSNEGDPFKTKLSKSKNQKNSNKDDDFLVYLNDKLNSYKTNPYANEFKEWRISPNGRVLVIMIVPSKPAGDVAYAKALKSHLDKTIQNLKKKHPKYSNIGVNYSGSYVTTVEETSEVKKDIISSIGLSIFLILLVLFLYFGRFKAILTILTPLIVGMIWTLGIFFIFDSYLNLIAAFIFAILLGLGIDFGIHILDRYLQERNDNKTIEESLLISMTETGKSIVIGGLTTSAAFFSLIFADFKGFSQFGKLASLGILLNIISIYVIFPILVIFFEEYLKGFGKKINFYKIIFKKFFKSVNQNIFIKTKLVIVVIMIILTSYSVIRLVKKPVKFEYDFRKLNKKSSSKKVLVKKYSSATKLSLSPAVILTNSAKETKDIHDVLVKLTKNQEDLVKQPKIFPLIKEYNIIKTYNMTKSIDTFGSIYSFYPDYQKEKQKILHSIDKMLTDKRIKHLSKDEQKTVQEIKPYLLSAVPFEIDKLPQFIKNIFKDKKEHYDRILYLYVKLNTTNGKNAIKFANEIRSIRVNGKKLKITAQPLIFADILILIVKDSYKVTIISFIFILIILLIFNRSIKKTLIMIIPLLLGMLTTLFFMSYFNIKLSFFNMMIIPTLIGMGIDNSVHLMHRYEALKNNNIYFAYKSIIGSITLSTTTTMIGFAGLLTANHQGLNSIGELAIIGMASMWFMVFLPMPALLQLFSKKEKNHIKSE
jgi:hypothetical protein